MGKWIVGAIVLLFGIVPCAAQCQLCEYIPVPGSIAADSTATEIRDDIGDSWNRCCRCEPKGDTEDMGGNALQIISDSAPCDWRQVMMLFNLPGGPLTVAHDYELTVTCVGPELQVDFAFCPSPGPCASVDVTNATTELSELELTTYETALPDLSDSGEPISGVVPTYGEWGAILAGLGLLAAGVVMILRFKN